jgi:nicotinate-nucleotide adenylyltransferase
MKIGIFSGSFNPVHRGHIALAHHVVQQGLVDEVWFIRTPQNPFKQPEDLIADDLRAEMLRRALAGHEAMRLCDIEDRLPRPSYTIDTLHALSAEFPQHDFYLMIGGDNWEVFDKWRNWQEILQHYHLLVYPRPGSLVGATRSGAALPTAHVTFLTDAPQYDISATELRAAVRRGDDAPLDRWLPTGVKPLFLSAMATTAEKSAGSAAE